MNEHQINRSRHPRQLRELGIVQATKFSQDRVGVLPQPGRIPGFRVSRPLIHRADVNRVADEIDDFPRSIPNRHAHPTRRRLRMVEEIGIAPQRRAGHAALVQQLLPLVRFSLLHDLLDQRNQFRSMLHAPGVAGKTLHYGERGRGVTAEALPLTVVADREDDPAIGGLE